MLVARHVSTTQLEPPQLPLSASQDAMRETAERIRELEMALRESMNTSAHREALWAQEEAARAQAQRE
ncbi:ELKS/Rab6-interacting/CAST family member 1-like protein, partial [Lates japonicus]